MNLNYGQSSLIPLWSEKGLRGSSFASMKIKMEMCACSRVPGSRPAPSISSRISNTDFSNLESKNTCGFSSCSAVNGSTTKCGSTTADGYQNLCPCVESGHPCRCKPSNPSITRFLHSCPFDDPRHHKAWPIVKKGIYISLAAIPIVWALAFITLKFYFHMI